MLKFTELRRVWAALRGACMDSFDKARQRGRTYAEGVLNQALHDGRQAFEAAFDELELKAWGNEFNEGDACAAAFDMGVLDVLFEYGQQHRYAGTVDRIAPGVAIEQN